MGCAHGLTINGPDHNKLFYHVVSVGPPQLAASSSSYTLSRDKQIQIIAAFCEGAWGHPRYCSDHPGVNRKTVGKLALDVGKGA
jgi:hypothetical protein